MITLNLVTNLGIEQCPIIGNVLNKIQPIVSRQRLEYVPLYISTCSEFVKDFPAAFRGFPLRATVPVPPELRERLLGKDTKSPLRLVVGRRWQNLDSFHDLLECGHESSLQFTSFGYIEDQYLHRIPPTAKRRRCQQCKEAIRVNAEVPNQKASELGALRPATNMQRARQGASDHPSPRGDEFHLRVRRVPKSSGSGLVLQGQSGNVEPAGEPTHNLYDSARAVLNTKKPVTPVKRGGKRVA